MTYLCNIVYENYILKFKKLKLKICNFHLMNQTVKSRTRYLAFSIVLKRPQIIKKYDAALKSYLNFME